jgi:hypothetical protein
MLALNCWLDGDDVSQVFPIKIPGTESVGSLKDAIKAKKKPVLDHIAADSLLLWKVSIPDDANLKESLDNLNGTFLSTSTAPVSFVFSDAPRSGYLHIVAKKPDGDDGE